MFRNFFKKVFGLCYYFLISICDLKISRINYAKILELLKCKYK